MRKVSDTSRDFAERRKMSIDHLRGRYDGRLRANAPLPAGAHVFPSSRRHGVASQYLEYTYYAAVFYGYMGELVGLSINMLGAGMIALLAGLCFLKLRAKEIFNVAFAFPILFTVSFVFVQIVIHSESLMQSEIRPVLIWMLTLIILSALCRRPGFIPRFAAALFLIGLTALPFVDLESSRAGLTVAAGVLTNPNGLAVFFGFIAVVFTIRGMESLGRMSSWLYMATALFSLLIVGLTVSRGPMVAYSLALVISLRKQLRRSFIPILALVALGGGAFALGLFDRVIGGYSERVMEDTGRFYLWSVAYARFIESPVAGVGASNAVIMVPNSTKIASAHNASLFVGLSSGIVPLLFFAGYWLMGLRGALKASPQNPAFPYLLPLWAYAFFLDQLGSQGFVEAWSAFCVCICLVQLIPKSRVRLGSKASVVLNPRQGRVPVIARPLRTRE
jgi:O-antigen ligase